MSKTKFQTLVHKAIHRLPPSISRFLDNVIIEVEPWPDRRTCRSLDLDDPSELMGLYHGTPLTERSVQDSGMLPDRIVLYQGSIESAAETPDEIVAEIRTTLLHEIGHYFGLDEPDLEELGYD